MDRQIFTFTILSVITITILRFITLVLLLQCVSSTFDDNNVNCRIFPVQVCDTGPFLLAHTHLELETIFVVATSENYSSITRHRFQCVDAGFPDMEYVSHLIRISHECSLLKRSEVKKLMTKHEIRHFTQLETIIISWPVVIISMQLLHIMHHMHCILELYHVVCREFVRYNQRIAFKMHYSCCIVLSFKIKSVKLYQMSYNSSYFIKLYLANIPDQMSKGSWIFQILY